VSDPLWLAEARKHLGLAEVPGKDHQPVIVGWLRELGSWYFDDETPWCGTFVAHCMRVTGMPVARNWFRAKAWAEWGQGLAGAVYGCVVVFERVGGGHVGLVVGRDQSGRLMVLGGNQGNRVSIAPFDGNRVVAYRWPLGQSIPPVASLPVIQSASAASTNEA
jgi:uncharacterized protein (TIGR02594 family)